MSTLREEKGFSYNELVSKVAISLIESDESDERRHIMSDPVEENKDTLTLMVIKFDAEKSENGIVSGDRYLAHISKANGDILSLVMIAIDGNEMAEIVKRANLGTLIRYHTHGFGVYGATYKVEVKPFEKQEESAINTYIVQLRYHGDVYSMNDLIQQIYKSNPKDLPVPENLFVSNESKCNLGIQISQHIPGILGVEIFKDLSFEHKICVVKQVARAFAALWDFQGAAHKNQRQLVAKECVSSRNITNRFSQHMRYKLQNEPFKTVSGYLQAWIKYRYEELLITGPEEFKEKYLGRIKHFIDNNLDCIPYEVNDIPLSVVSVDMALHNMIFTEPLQDSAPKLAAVIDWELVYYLPFLVNIPTKIDPMFNSGSSEEERSTLKTIFWDEIPKWKEILNSSGGQAFLEYYEFGQFLRPDSVHNTRGQVEIKWKIWEKNTQVVEDFLSKHAISSQFTLGSAKL